MRFLFSILFLAIATASCAAVGDGSYWTISLLKQSLPESAFPTCVSLLIKGADRITVGNIPSHWGVDIQHDRSGAFAVAIRYIERDGGASLEKLTLARILSGIEIRSGPAFGESDNHGDDYRPDRSTAVTASMDVYFFTAFDPLRHKLHREGKSIEVDPHDLQFTFHNVELIAGGDVIKATPNHSPEPTPGAVR